MLKDSTWASDLSLVEPRRVAGYYIQLVRSVKLSREVFRDGDFQHIQIWGRVLENLLKDKVQQCSYVICNARNKNLCLQKEIALEPKSLAAVMYSFFKLSFIYTFSLFIIYFEGHVKSIFISFVLYFSAFVLCLFASVF